MVIYRIPYYLFWLNWLHHWLKDNFFVSKIMFLSGMFHHFVVVLLLQLDRTVGCFFRLDPCSRTWSISNGRFGWVPWIIRLFFPFFGGFFSLEKMPLKKVTQGYVWFFVVLCLRSCLWSLFTWGWKVLCQGIISFREPRRCDEPHWKALERFCYKRPPWWTIWRRMLLLMVGHVGAGWSQ